MATKINHIIQELPKNSLVFSAWMTSCGIQRSEQVAYVRSGWLERLAIGVYFIKGAKPSLFNAVSSYNSQLEKKCYIGASTALDLKGYFHFIPMGHKVANLFTKKGERLPSWMLNNNWDMELRYFTTNIFNDELIGVDEFDYNDFKLLISYPERAILECLHLAPIYYSLMDIYYIMEMLTALRPKVVQQLLEICSSVKVKRVFLFMAEKANYGWFKDLDLSKIDLGRGKRVVEKDGVYNNKYMITISKELANYE